MFKIMKTYFTKAVMDIVVHGIFEGFSLQTGYSEMKSISGLQWVHEIKAAILFQAKEDNYELGTVDRLLQNK